MVEAEWPYNLPIWRRYHRAASPDGTQIAQINPAFEVSMGNPTSGTLCVSSGLHIARCNPSFIWSDDSQYLAVPQYFNTFIITRQRVLVISFRQRRAYASRKTAFYFQPESFTGGRLVVTREPFKSRRTLEFHIPSDLQSAFRQHFLHVEWADLTPGPEMQQR